jgi:hypothetical protein
MDGGANYSQDGAENWLGTLRDKALRAMQICGYLNLNIGGGMGFWSIFGKMFYGKKCK